MTSSILPSKSDIEAQTLRQHAGKVFEENVAYSITRILSREDIYAVSLKELKDLVKEHESYRQVLEFAKLPIKSPCVQAYEMVLPDTDVVVYYTKKDETGQVSKRYHLATISCKVSFHGRHTESTFWASQLRDHGAKFVLATEDKSNELGYCDKGNNQTRRLLESYMDSVYLMKKYEGSSESLNKDIVEFYDVFERSKETGFRRMNTNVLDSRRSNERYCRQVRPFDDLYFDLMQWKFRYKEKT